MGAGEFRDLWVIDALLRSFLGWSAVPIVRFDDKLVSSRRPDDIPAFIREMTAVFAKTRRQARPAA